MANILTETEAAAVLRVGEDDALMIDMLSQVDAYIEQATGRDWTADDPVRAEAKSAARMLLVKWYEDPGALGVAFGGALGFGLGAALMQLEALALELEDAGTPAEALAIRTSMPVDGAYDIASQCNLVVIFNHEMASGAIAQASLADLAGNAVATTNSLDATGKILTVSPNSALSVSTNYVLSLNAIADVYGLTLTDTISFKTAAY